MELPQLDGNKIAIISGSGILPKMCAQSAATQGAQVYLVDLIGESESLNSIELKSIAKKIFKIKVGQLGKLIKILKHEKINLVTFAGGVKKPNLFSFFSMDWRAICLLKKIQAGGTGDDRVLRAIANEFDSEGIKLIGAAQIIPNILVPAGRLTNRQLSEQELSDAKLGFEIAAKIGELDIGQAVVIRQGSVIAVEAIEGTNAMLERAGKLSGLHKKYPEKDGLVLVKRAKPQQDLRLDLPTIGIDTIKLMHEVGAKALILEANKCQVLDLQNVVSLANKLDLSLEVF